MRGASGFLGESLSRALVDRVDRLRLFARSAARIPGELTRRPHVEVVEGDALDAAVVARSLAGVDLVVDAIGATVPGGGNADLTNEVELHLRPLAILLGAVARRGPLRLFFLSSGGAAYGETASEAPIPESTATAPQSAYGMGKVLAEEMIRFHARRGHLEYCIARPSNVYGRRVPGRASQGVVDEALRRILDGLPLELWGDGTQVRDYLFVDDFVGAAMALLETSAPELVVHVATGEGTRLDRLLEVVRVTTGSNFEPVRRPAAFSGVSRNVLAIDRLTALTGWKPRFSIEDGIAEAWRRLRDARLAPASDPAPV